MSLRLKVSALTPSGEVIKLTHSEAFEKVKAGLAYYTDDEMKEIVYMPQHEARGKLDEWQPRPSIVRHQRKPVARFLVLQLV